MFEDRDLKGKKIEQTAKSSKSVEIDGNKRFCGHRFLLKTKLYGDKRCIYCGKWFHWSQEDSSKWVARENIDEMNVDTVLEPLHCGSSHCDDYHIRYLRHQYKMAEEQKAKEERQMMDTLKWAKQIGLL